MKRNKLIDKKLYKLVAKKCIICGEDDYEALDVHRFKIEGKDGGRYIESNSSCLCANCHRKTHAGIIKIDNWYNSTAGMVLRWFDEKGQEHFS